MSTLTPRTKPQARRWWFNYPAGQRNTVKYWVLYALAEPRDFAYYAPRRLACRLFSRHNVTCRGRPDHRTGAKR